MSEGPSMEAVQGLSTADTPREYTNICALSSISDWRLSHAITYVSFWPRTSVVAEKEIHSRLEFIADVDIMTQYWLSDVKSHS